MHFCFYQPNSALYWFGSGSPTCHKIFYRSRPMLYSFKLHLIIFCNTCTCVSPTKYKKYFRYSFVYNHNNDNKMIIITWDYLVFYVISFFNLITSESDSKYLCHIINQFSLFFIRVSSVAVSRKTWCTHATETKTARSTRWLETVASTAGCRSALRLACLKKVRN